MFALVVGQAASPLADNVSELGLDFLRLLGGEIGDGLRFMPGMVGRFQQVCGRKRNRGSKGGAATKVATGNERFFGRLRGRRRVRGVGHGEDGLVYNMRPSSRFCVIPTKNRKIDCNLRE
jgi:hypothetical protein